MVHNTHGMALPRLAAAAFVLLLVFNGAAAQRMPRRINSVLALGDSISDAGLPFGIWAYDNQTYPYTALGYWNGRFSNGPVWIDYLSYKYNLTGVSFAVGGATVNTLPSRTNLEDVALNYLRRTSLRAPAVAIISIGANDLSDLAGLPILNNLTAVLQYSNNIVRGTMGAARRMLQAGIQHVLVIPTFNALPYAPLARALGVTSPALLQQLTMLVSGLNSALQEQVGRLANDTKLGTVMYLDVAPELQRFVKNPERFGLINARESCLELDPPGTGRVIVNGTLQMARLLSTCSSPNGYLFWDALHLTSTGQRLVAEFIAKNLRRVRLL